MHSVLASVMALQGSRSWWNRPMVWASLAAIAYGGWLAVRRSQKRAAREAAADEEAEAAATVRAEERDRIDEAMNRLGRDWQPGNQSGPGSYPEQ
jgi:DNA-directed RNA polymerase specialized sigma24 family protein